MEARANKRWALVGPGAVGLFYGGSLAASGKEMHILARTDYDAMRDGGISIRMKDPVGRTLLEEKIVRPTSVAREASAIGLVDFVVIAAKATVNDALLEPLLALVEPGRTVVLALQNGLGNAEFYARHFPENPVLIGLCFVCVNRTAPAVVENYLPGRVEIGTFEDRWRGEAEETVAAFEGAGIRTSFAPVLEAALWRKLCWNVPFNGLAIAGGGITTDRILADPDLNRRAHALMEEVRSVAGALGHPIGDRFIAGQFEVTETMGAYRPSSLIDYLDGRDVEIEAIWGEPLRRGEALGLELPEMARVYEEIRRAVARI